MAGQQLTLQVRSRACVLSLVFAHACSGLLAVSADSVQSASSAHQTRAEHRLTYAGSDAEYVLLHSIAELSLYLLGTHLVALRWISEHGPSLNSPSGCGPASAITPPPGLGTPRLAFVIQCLRALRQFSTATGGRMVPVPNLAACDMESAQALDFVWLSCLAEKVEELLNELQSL